MQFQLSRPGAGAIEPVAHYGDAQPFFVGSVQAELVCAARKRHELHASLAILNTELTPAGSAELPALRVVDLIGTIVRVQSEGEFYDSRILFDLAVKQRDVSLAHQLIHELHGDIAVSLFRKSEHQKAGSILIQPMN